MILFHGAAAVIKKPSVTFARNYLDFGPGFYMTSILYQAEKWALRKSIRTNSPGIVNQYDFDEQASDYRVKVFDDNNDDEWLDYICQCRCGDTVYQQYDVVIGGVADDEVYKVIDMYFRGLWDKKRALAEIKFYRPSNQICFLSQSILDNHLRFLEAKEVTL